MGHTPGPWAANGGDIMCEDNYCVAVAYRARTDDEGNWMPNAEVDANARLIAAAPELLAALKWLLLQWEEAVNWEPDYMDMGDAARAAIAKAEGRSE